jgi:hypothetical protein
MIRRLSSLALGCAVALSGASAFAQDDEEVAPAEEAPAEEAAPAGAAAGGTAEASLEGMPESKGAFGKAGQIAISSDFELSFESRSFKAPAGEDPESQTTITLAPALDYFVIDGLSVGGQIAFTRISQGDSSAQLIGIGPRVGYNIGLTDNISFWPKLGFAYAMISAESEGVDPVTGATTTSDVSGSRMMIGIDAPILFHPAEHFFIGLGPFLSMDLSSKVEDNDATKETAFGLQSVVGGWF